MQLHKLGPSGVTEIARLLAVSRPAASQMVDRLVAQGWLARAEDRRDRRFTRLTLTPAGTAMTLRCIAARTRWLNNLPALTVEQQTIICDGLQALTEAATTLMGREQELNE